MKKETLHFLGDIFFEVVQITCFSKLFKQLLLISVISSDQNNVMQSEKGY